MAKEAESMTIQTDLMLKIRCKGENLKENGLLAYHTDLNEYADENDYRGTFFVEQFEKNLVEMLKLIYRYNNEVKELVKWVFGF